MEYKALYLERLKEIVDISYKILIQKIGNGSIKPWNEASFQLEFGIILKAIGHLYEFDIDDKFHLEFETGKKFNEISNKSGSNTARIDIFMMFKNKDVCVTAAIELKFFKKENLREPNNRYDVFKDLKNLELYKNNDVDLCFFILGTNHSHYVGAEKYSKATSDFDFRDSTTYIKGTVLEYKTANPYGRPISLDNNYSFNWDKFENIYFLKVEVA